ncbi:hypothetical protein HDZ31DRAFT_15276, partial [Schizophyllum fasciatum]
QPKVLERKFIGKNIVMLRCEASHDSEQIRLQYRDGTPLARPNTIGFELIDRLARKPTSWHGFGKPLVYHSCIYKRGSYVLRYRGREVWTYSTDDRAEGERLDRKPYDTDGWNRIMNALGAQNPVPHTEVNILFEQGNILLTECPTDLPQDLFVPCDLEFTHQLKLYKQRTGHHLR